MSKNTKIKKFTAIKDKGEEKDVKKVTGEDEETEKESGTLSDGVLDAFDEVAPVDSLLEEESTLLESEEEDELDSGDYRPSDEW